MSHRSTFVSRASLRLALSGALLAPGALAGCSSTSDNNTSTASDCPIEVVANKELVIVEPSVIDDVRAKNATNGPWSFRHAIEAMAPAGREPGEMVEAWLSEWVTKRTFNGYTLDAEADLRANEMRIRVVCPWLQRSPENGCDATCGQCKERKLDVAKAPFRLLAISNRMDLRTAAGAVGPSGEGRLVFGLARGNGDDAPVMGAMTVILEYRLPDSLNVREWAERWHALGAHSQFDDAYRMDLETLTEKFVARNASPDRPNGSAISQLRSNEVELNWIWQMREFRLGNDGAIHIASTKNTPSDSLNASPGLAAWMNANAKAIVANKYEVPEGMLSASIPATTFSWQVPGVAETTRKAFAQNTCNGCHTSEQVSVDTAFHVSPFRSGMDKLSNHVLSDLPKRAEFAKQALCSGN